MTISRLLRGSTVQDHPLIAAARPGPAFMIEVSSGCS